MTDPSIIRVWGGHFRRERQGVRWENKVMDIPVVCPSLHDLNEWPPVRVN